MISVILFKMSKQSDFHLIFFQIKGARQDFTVVTKLIKNFKSLYGFGGRFLKIRDVCMDLDFVSDGLTRCTFFSTSATRHITSYITCNKQKFNVHDTVKPLPFTIHR